MADGPHDHRWQDERALAHALCAGDKDAQDFFTRQLRLRFWGFVLRFTAGWRTRIEAEPEVVLQNFLVEKVLDFNKAQAVLGPVAEGQRTLWPQIYVCLRNFIIDVLRGPPPLPPGGENGSFDPAGLQDDSSQTTESENWVRLAGERAEYLQTCSGLFARYRAPYYQVLLLSERVLMAERITLGRREGDWGDLKTVWFAVADVVEQWVPWPTEAGEWTFGPHTPTLGEVWGRIRLRLEQWESPNLEDVANLLSAPRGRWDKWLSRVRRIIGNDLGEDGVRELFPYWPRGQSEHR